jgi:cyanophycin synthetase
MKIFSITGTKGKTSITRLLSYLLHALGENVLRVDSEGHLVNEVKQSTFGDSIHLFGNLAPTVCPGKYLITMKDFYPAFVAVMESSISCGQEGLGYKNHQIGIFTNVYRDHITGRPGRKNQKDLAKAKNFVFQKIATNGFALFNADDNYVCSQLKTIPKEKNVTLLPVGINFSFFNLKKHLSGGGEIVTLENNFVVIKSEKETKKIININLVPWTFAGN